MQENEINELISEELVAVTNLPKSKCDEVATKYVEAVISELIRNEQFKTDDGVYQIQQSRIVHDSGRFKINGKLLYAYTFIQKMQCRLLQVLNTGSTGINSTAKINPEFEHRLRERIMNQTLNTNQFEEDEEVSNTAGLIDVVIPVDAASLLRYISATKQTLKSNNKGVAYNNKLENNLIYAKLLLDELETRDGIDVFVEKRELKDTGREYAIGKGKRKVTLQGAPKEVRHAVLGHCYKYDMKAASFALMQSVAALADQQKGTATFSTPSIRHYVSKRDVVRKQIALLLGIDEKLVKEVFTSIGFGAKPVANPFNAVGKLLNKDQIEKLKSIESFSSVYAEIEQINKLVDETYTGDFVFLNKTYTNTYTHCGKTKEKSRAKKLAWIYQVTEAFALRSFIELVHAFEENCGLTPTDVMMTVHDCVYFKSPIASDVLNSVLWLMRDTKEGLSLELFNVDRESINPVGTVPFSEADEEVRKHQQLIRDQELAIEEHNRISQMA